MAGSSRTRDYPSVWVPEGKKSSLHIEVVWQGNTHRQPTCVPFGAAHPKILGSIVLGSLVPIRQPLVGGLEISLRFTKAPGSKPPTGGSSWLAWSKGSKFLQDKPKGGLAWVSFVFTKGQHDMLGLASINKFHAFFTRARRGCTGLPTRQQLP